VERLASFFWWLFSIILFAGFWEALSRLGILNTFILPPPSVFLREGIFPESYGLSANSGRSALGTTALMILASISRVLAGMFLGLAGALPCGIVMARIKWLDRLVGPVFTVLAPLAPLAWIPLILVVVGVGNIGAITVVFVGVFFLLTLATINAARAVDRRYLELAKFLGAGKAAQIIFVIVPASLPSIFFILRINFFAAWMAVLTAEGIGVTSGLGALVIMARATANFKLMLAAMSLIAGSGVLIDLSLRLLQNRLLGWHKEQVG
jgi:ABC-type nitrate/sulfonate/bicarbonate transport system permease component